MKQLRERAFDAAVARLVGDAPQSLAWANLGDWAQTEDYLIACQHLAQRLGQAAELRPGAQVLDLAFGQGASLKFWLREYPGIKLDGLELRADYVERASLMLAGQDGIGTLAAVDLNQLAANQVLPAQSYDALICVDAAYHVRELRQFIAGSARLLKVGGRLVLSTLVHCPSAQRSWRSRLCVALLQLSGIAVESQLKLDSIADEFERFGFHAPIVKWLDQEVLQGFADHVSRLRRQQRWRERLSLGWLSLECSGLLCRTLLKSKEWRYALIHLQKKRPTQV